MVKFLGQAGLIPAHEQAPQERYGACLPPGAIVMEFADVGGYQYADG
jgi:hypothetical protein